MLVLVDTSVWIDFFAGNATKQVDSFEKLIEAKQDLCICGIILTEILQGIRNDSEYKKTKELLSSLVFLPITNNTFLKSADIYRLLRKKGITIRRATDCIIASVAIENKIPLLHNDKDFNPIEKYCGLKSYTKK